jgi:transcriptional regulator with XRE-family HTH domain
MCLTIHFERVYSSEMLTADVRINGEVFRRRREEKGLSMRDLEDRTGVSRSTISNLETGRNVPDGVNLLTLMKFLDLSMEEVSRS